MPEPYRAEIRRQAAELADARHELDVLRGGITDFSERLDLALGDLTRARAERDEARAEVADLRALFDLQFTRMGEATERWRAEDPESRALVMPDLGNLLQWLMAQRDQALTEIADATKQAAGWMDEARRQAAERDREFQRAEQVTAERDRRGEELRRAQDVIEAAKVRAQVLRDLREFGSGAEGWPERDRISDKAVLVAVDALDHGEVAAMGDH